MDLLYLNKLYHFAHIPQQGRPSRLFLTRNTIHMSISYWNIAREQAMTFGFQIELLPVEGLLIIHINERFRGPASTWLLRDAPYFDPEFANFSDNGGALWSDALVTNGVLFPHGTNNSFTSSTSPSSNFYGQRPSGLSISNVRIGSNQVSFELSIDCRTYVGWIVSDEDMCMAGRFSPESLNGAQEILCRSAGSAALLECVQAQWFVKRRHDNQVDGWSFGIDDYQVVGDFDGDNLDELYVQNSNDAAILKWRNSGFHVLDMEHDWIGGWNLGNDNYGLTADIDGDRRKEIYIRSPRYVGILKLEMDYWQLQYIRYDRVGGWSLGPNDKEWSGKFTQRQYDEIVIRSPEYLGLISWDTGLNTLESRQIQYQQIGGWSLSAEDKHCIGDFDGDGLDEIYVRSPQRAGILKWSGDRFDTTWMRQSDIPYYSGSESLSLAGTDWSYKLSLLPDKDGILHVGRNGLSLLSFDRNEMRVRRSVPAVIDNAWTLSSSDNFVIGKFQIVEPSTNNYTDPRVVNGYLYRIDNAFIHNDWGTGMIGFNRPSVDPFNQRPDEDQLGLAWINEGEILVRSSST